MDIEQAPQSPAGDPTATDVPLSVDDLYDAVRQAYPPLDQTKREIRVLELDPALLDDNRLQSRLITVDLDQEHAHYYAVSYAWGPRALDSSIEINGIDFQIPAKQSAILLAIWSMLATDSVARVWLDLLCINQDDVHEKNRQVSLMGDIFRQAHGVYVYINNYTSHGTSPQSVLSTSYWLRRWIIQELVLAREIYVILGGVTMKWDEFCTFMRNVEFRALRECGDQWSTFNSIKTMRSRKVLIKHPLHQLLLDFRHTESTEPYDRIFALLSLANVKDRSRIQVDYRKSLFGLFLEVASLIDPSRELNNYFVLDVLYSELATRVRYALHDFQAFASVSPLLMIGLLKYYGTVVRATKQVVENFRAVVNVSRITVRADADGASNVLEDWYTVFPSTGNETIEAGDICWIVEPFSERLLLGRGFMGQVFRCYGRANKLSHPLTLESSLRYFLSSTSFELQPRAGFGTSFEFPPPKPHNVLYIKFNGAALVEFVHHWKPHIGRSGDTSAMTKLNHILSMDIIQEIRALKRAKILKTKQIETRGESWIFRGLTWVLKRMLIALLLWWVLLDFLIALQPDDR